MTWNSADVLGLGEVFAVARAADMTPAFAIPLVQAEGRSNASYIQTVGLDGKVIGFELCSAGSLDVVQSPERVLVAIGDDEICGFIAPDGGALVGTKSNLAETVKHWLKDIEYPLTRLAFSEFCGDRIVGLEAAQEAFDAVAESAGRRGAISWFANSVVFRRMQTAALTASPMKDVAATEQALREVDFSIGDGRVVASVPSNLFDLLETAEKQGSPSFSHMSMLAAEVTKGLFVVEKRPDVRIRARRTRKLHAAPVLELADAVGVAGRQEERIALLLRALLADYAWGKAGLGRYRVRTRFERMALEIIAGRLLIFNDADVDHLEYRISNIVSDLYKDTFPLARGRLLYDFSRHLSRYKIVSSTITQILAQSNSMFVNQYRAAISEHLSEGMSLGKPDPLAERHAIVEAHGLPLFSRR